MGSLKRKNASLGASASSNKRPARDEISASSASANGYTGRRGGVVRSSSSSSSAGAAAVTGSAPALEQLSNGSTSAKTITDPNHYTGPALPVQMPDFQENLTISEREPARTDNSKDQDAMAASSNQDTEHPKSSGPLIPNHAGWFSWDSIHPVEQRGVPEFFNSKSKLKTPAIYMECRNLLIKKYLDNPDKLFTPADVADAISDHTGGRLEAAKRIFEFLNHWGLLNARVFHNDKVDKVVAEAKPSIGEGMSGQSQWSLTSSLYRFENPLAFPAKSLSLFAKSLPAASLTETTVAELQAGEQGMSIEYHCNSCAADCSKRRFHCQKQADFDLCPDCYNEGKFSTGITKTDFILMEAVTDANDSSGWSDQETLLLLEALELFGDNFSEIAEHVGTKTKAQCILHFIRLPIEDPFLDAAEANASSVTPASCDSVAGAKSSNPTCQGDDNQDEPSKDQTPQMVPEDNSSKPWEPSADHNPDDTNESNGIMAAARTVGLYDGVDKYISLSECSNPVMTLAAFLGALVSPDVAATSAQSALKVLADHASALQLADEHSYHLEAELPTNYATSTAAAESHEERVREAEGVVQLASQPDAPEASEVVVVSEVGVTDDDALDHKGDANDRTMESLTRCSSFVRVKNAAATALAAAAVKAKFLAEQEEWEILRLAAFVVDSQTKKIETKLKLFRELDVALEKEHNLLERSRQRLFAERSQIAATRAVQSTVSGQYTSLNASVVPGGPRPPPHAMLRPPASFTSSVPPVMAGPHSASAQNDYSRGSPNLIKPPSMTATRPVYYKSNSGAQFHN